MMKIRSWRNNESNVLKQQRFCYGRFYCHCMFCTDHHCFLRFRWTSQIKYCGHHDFCKQTFRTTHACSCWFVLRQKRIWQFPIWCPLDVWVLITSNWKRCNYCIKTTWILLCTEEVYWIDWRLIFKRVSEWISSMKLGRVLIQLFTIMMTKVVTLISVFRHIACIEASFHCRY